MPTIALYVPADVFRRHGSDPGRIRVLCKQALADTKEPWPEPAKVKERPSQAEKDWPTEDPPELTPDDVDERKTVAFAPIDDPNDHFKPDPKGKK